MKARWPALALGLLALGLFVYGATLDVESESLAVDIMGVIAIAAPSIAGCYLGWRLPHNPVGWLLIGFGITFTLGVMGEMMALTGHFLAPWGAWLDLWQWSVSATLILVQLPLRFPDGDLPAPGYRWVTPVSAVGVILVFLGNAFGSSVTYATSEGALVVELPIPLGISPGLSGLVSTGGSIVLLITVVAALAAAVGRFRRSHGMTRQQMKVFASALVLSVAAMATNLWLYAIGSNLVANGLSALLVIFLVSSIAVAVLRYRLYEFDRLISRTVSYAIVIGLLVAVYALGAVWLPTRFANLESPLFVAGSTLLVAALFNPLRRRVMRWVDRRFNRARYDAERIAESFAAKLREPVHSDRVLEEWTEVITGTFEPSALAIWLREPRRDG